MSDLYVCCRSSRLYSRSRMGVSPHVRIERDAQVAAPAGGSANRCDRRGPHGGRGVGTRRDESSSSSQDRPRVGVKNESADTSYHTDTTTTQYGHSDAPPTAPIAPRRPTRHCIVVPGGTGARHCSTPRGSERVCLRPHVDTARGIARHDSCGAHRTTHARHTSCDCACHDNGARGAHTCGMRRPGVLAKHARDAAVTREQRAAAPAAGASSWRSR